MSVVHNKGGFAMPFMLRDIRSQAITSAFAPTTQEYIKHGFLVMPAADLTLEVITWDRYHANGNTTVGLTAVSVFCIAGQWLPCPIVHVGAESGVTVNIGVI